MDYIQSALDFEFLKGLLRNGHKLTIYYDGDFEVVEKPYRAHFRCSLNEVYDSIASHPGNGKEDCYSVHLLETIKQVIENSTKDGVIIREVLEMNLLASLLS